MSLRPFVKHLVRNRTLCYYTLTVSPSEPDPEPPPTAAEENDPHSLMNEDPIEICSSMWIKSFASRTTTPVKNLSQHLSKFGLWVLAYQRTCAHVVGAFPARAAIGSMALNDLLALRNDVVHGRFTWNDKLDQVLRAPFGKPPEAVISQVKLQELAESEEPCFQDLVVQKVLLMILEPIFEARFSPKSHAFRPKRNAHTVLRTIRTNFGGFVWWVRGDLSGVFESVEQDVIMRCLEKTVQDEVILGLVNSALETPVQIRWNDSEWNLELEEQMKKNKNERRGKKPKSKKHRYTRKRILKDHEPKPDPYWLRCFFAFAPPEASKIPSYSCCGILSPLLANVCLDEFDKFMEDEIAKFFRPSKDDSIWKESISDGPHNQSWPEFVPLGGKGKTLKMDYVRYAGHFLIGIRGPREAALDIRGKVIKFCDSRYGLYLDSAKVEIEHITRGIEFLDHVISRRMIYPTLHYTSSGGNIVSEKGAGTLLSVTASLYQCIRHFRDLLLVKGNRDPEPLPCKPMLFSGQAHSNAQMNKFLEAMADWYRYADNRKTVVGFCAYVVRSSLAKLYAARYKLRSRAKVYRLGQRNLSRPLIEHSKNKAPEYSDLLRMGLVDIIEGVQFAHMSLIPSCDYTPFPKNWAPHHEKVIQEYIKLDNPKHFCELYQAVKTSSMKLPQEKLSEAVWDIKTLNKAKMDYTAMARTRTRSVRTRTPTVGTFTGLKKNQGRRAWDILRDRNSRGEDLGTW